MAGRVIQGFFVGGRAPASLENAAPAAGAQARAARPGPPPMAFARPPAAAQRHPVQRHAAHDSFAIDPARIGLGAGRGNPLPAPVLAKMEAAFGADFSGVRIHVGPQAGRIGAVAFTTGNDIYFAPGRYQPDTVSGQQLLGHELAHVVQQRQGRVRMPASGVAVVQDRALEAEADRLGARAAAHVAVQAKAAPGGGARVRVSEPQREADGRYRVQADVGGRNVGSLLVHVNAGRSALVTDLGVDPAHRSLGIGKMLLASAARAGQRFGKGSVTLTADDNGSGKLNRWYGGLGFARAGSDPRGRPRMEAPVGQLLRGAAQPKLAPRAWGRVGDRHPHVHGMPIQRASSTGSTGSSGGSGGPPPFALTLPPPVTGTVTVGDGTYRMRLWSHFGSGTFTVDQFCTEVGSYGAIGSRSGQLALLRRLRAGGGLFPPITEDVRDGLLLSFDATQAQQAPVRTVTTMTNRQAFGMGNPSHDDACMVPFWEAHANTPPPSGRDPVTHYMSPSRHYRIGDNEGNPVIDPSTGKQKLEQDHRTLVMGHKKSAGQYVNDEGHTKSPRSNRQYNHLPSSYGQVENALESSKSGSREARYRSPSPTRGSWEGYYLRDHPEFKPGYRDRWRSHIRKQCSQCGNRSDHEAALVCSVCHHTY